MNYVGIVTGGSARAYKLGYPTANIPLPDATVSGIYAACVTLEGKTYQAVAFADPVRGILEAHLFDFSGDLYGKEIQVSLSEKLRESQEFASEEELRAAMQRDAEQARTIRECRDMQ